MADTREQKHLQRLKELHAKGRFFPNNLDQTGLCHIHHATLRGYLHCAKWLHKHGSSLTLRSAEGSLPAHYAAAGGHLECLKWIHRKASKSICTTDFKGATPLYFSAQEGHVNCLEWLAKYSGTVYWELPGDGMTAVHAAAVEGHLECLAFLLRSAGCRALVRDRAGNTPLHYAAACGRRHCVEWFLSNTNSLGNERNKLGSSPLHIAALNGHLEVVKLLVRRGVAIKLRDRMGRTPFNVAESSGNEACAQFLEQMEVNSLEMYNRVGTPNLKRVRFERKAIERDSKEVQAHHSGQFERSIVSTHTKSSPQKPYSLYRNRADNLVTLQRPGNVTMEEAIDRVSRGRGTQLDNSLRHRNRVPQRHAKSHLTSTSLLPWSRVYEMTQFTEAIPSSPQANVHSFSDSDGSEKPKSIENPSSMEQRTSLVSKIFSKRKDKELFPADIDHFDDIINNTSKNKNIFKRLYRFSKEKLTRSSSFALENMPESSLHRKESIVVSGNDDFIARSTVITDQECHQEKHMNQETEKKKVTPTGIGIANEMCDSVEGLNEYQNIPRKRSNGKKPRKRTSLKEMQGITTSRDNSMIW